MTEEAQGLCVQREGSWKFCVIIAHDKKQLDGLGIQLEGDCLEERDVVPQDLA